MQVRGLDHINMRISATDFDEVVDFYVGVLGLTVGERPPFASIGTWLYAGGQPIVHLVQAGRNEPANRHSPDVIDHVAFSCTDIEKSIAHLDAAGIDYDETTVPQRSVRQLFFKDPVGVTVELIFDE
jgi:catechol 2,3-dioxygenase-like lactoylglutathione lyase family enzyme